MRQLLLDLEPDKPQTLANFVVSQNRELAQLLTQFAAHAEQLPAERFVYLWGEAGAGKTHLLKALAASGAARYIGPEDSAASADGAAFLFTPAIRLYLLDDCDALPAPAQIAAFALFNQIREHGALLVSAGALPPAQLALREDLRTRLGWGLIYQVHGLSDDDKLAALSQAAVSRGLSLSPGVLPYLITHFRRDMRSLSAMLDALDRYSLETRRPITLPLLRHLLQLENESPTA
ncbi:MAG TPA: DnaA regulatory inactivator Hda [Burkholderiaceae bacterium]|nr:DnaA regulatory inactivator Hda [Burkholderiaceae bacterium]